MSSFKEIFNFILDVLFPKICVGCQNDLTKTEDLICSRCFNSIIIRKNTVEISDLKIYAAADYDGPIVRLIHAMKFNEIKEASLPLSKIVLEYFNNSDLVFKNRSGMTIVPMPLHFLRQAKRGFNQSEEIGKEIGKELGISIETQAIKRSIYRRAQSEIDDYGIRKENILNCFSQGKNIEKLKDHTVIIIDDVVTSGATMKEAIKIIKGGKPKEVICLAVSVALKR